MDGLQEGVELTSETLSDYHSDGQWISKSMIKEFEVDRDLYARRYVHVDPLVAKPVVTKEMNIGSAIHECVLMGENLENVVEDYPADCLNKNGDLIGVNAKKLREAFPDTIFLKPKEVEHVRNAVKAIMSGPLGEAVSLATGIERSFRWIGEHGIRQRMRPDIWCDMGDHISVIDLKCSEDISDGGFLRSMYAASWWLQSAHYTAGMLAAFRKPVSFKFCSVETVYPFRTKMRWLDPRSAEIASDRRKALLADMASCYENDTWDSGWQSAVTLAAKWNDV